MKQLLKWALVGFAVVGCWAAAQRAHQDFVLSTAPPEVVVTRPGIAADSVVVTYFSSDVRCATCVRIERLTRETIERNFDQELRSGRVVFRVVNLDQPGNSHYIRDYSLISKTVIVSDLARGQEIAWENLQQVWTKQRDEQAFDAYIADTLRRHLAVDS